MLYVKSLQTVLFKEPPNPLPADYLREIHGKSKDLNYEYGGQYSYLKVHYTNNLSEAATGFKIERRSSYTPTLGTDFAAGTGGDYRYVVTEYFGNRAIVDVCLWRCDDPDISNPSNDGWSYSQDLNGGRGKTYLFVCWQATTSKRTVKPNLVKDGVIVNIRSINFPGYYLRMDGIEAKAWAASGSGVVNCQKGAASYEKFRLRTIKGDHDRDDSFAFESVQFPGVYLRMDGTATKRREGDGSGMVNCQRIQNTPGSWETFFLHEGWGGDVSIESVAFPNVYLRMDPVKNMVNCQKGAGTSEEYYIKSVKGEVFVDWRGDKRIQWAKDLKKIDKVFTQDAKLFNQFYTFLGFVHGTTSEKIKKAKQTMTNVVTDIDDYRKKNRKIGDASDGVGISAGVLGIFGTFLCLVPGAEGFGVAMLVASGAGATASLGTGITELVRMKEFQTKVKNLGKDVDDRLKDNEAVNAMHTFESVYHVSEAYRKMNSRLPFQSFLPFLCSLYTTAKTKKEYKEALNSIPDNPKDLVDSWRRLVHHCDTDHIVKVLKRYNQEDFDQNLGLMIGSEGIILIPKYMLYMIMYRVREEAGEQGIKIGYDKLADWFKKGADKIGLKGLRKKNVAPGVEEEMEVLGRRSRIFLPAANEAEAAKNSANIMRFSQLSTVSKVMTVGGVVLDAASIGISIYSLIDRASTDEEYRKLIEEAHKAFDGAMDSVDEFRKEYID